MQKRKYAISQRELQNGNSVEKMQKNGLLTTRQN